MKYAINSIEAVRSFYNDNNIKIRIRYYNEGKEVSKADATEFTVSGTDVAYVEPVVEATAEAVAPKVRKPRTESKAYKLRQHILEMKASSAYDYEATVDWAQSELSFKRQLARVYVKIAAERVDTVEAVA